MPKPCAGAPELVVSGYLKHWLEPGPGVRRKLRRNEHYVIVLHTSGRREVVVDREMNIPSLSEARTNEVKVRQAVLDELTRWYELGAFSGIPRGWPRT